MTTQNPENLVTVTSTPTEFEAHTIVAVLREAGIEAFAFGTVDDARWAAWAADATPCA